MKSNKIQTIFWHTFSAFKNVFQITLLNASVFATFQWRNSKNYPYSVQMYAYLGI